MANLKLSETGDLAIESNRLVLVDGVDEIRQNWLIAVRTIKGEWFLDQEIGVPYVQVPGITVGNVVTDKAISRRELQQLIADASRRVPGVLQVNLVTIGEIDLATRKVAIQVECTIDGTGGESQEFTFSDIV